MRLQTLDVGRGLEIGPDIDAALAWIEQDRDKRTALVTCDATAHMQQVALRLDAHYRKLGDPGSASLTRD
jgi:hypothetical protein